MKVNPCTKLWLPFWPKGVAFCADAAGFESGRDGERGIFYRGMRRADAFATGAEVEIAAIRRPAWGDGAAHSLRLAAAGIIEKVGDFTDLIQIHKRHDHASGA